VTSDSGRITINPSGTTLTIGLVYASDAGTYECVAESAGGRRTAAAQLSVITQGLSSRISHFKQSYLALRRLSKNKSVTRTLGWANRAKLQACYDVIKQCGIRFPKCV